MTISTDRLRAAISSRTARRGSAMSGKVRTGSAASPASRGSASTSASPRRSPPSTSPAQRRRDRDEHPGRGRRGAVVGRGALVAPPPGEPLLRPAAGRGPALQVGPVGRRAQHHPVPGDADRMRAAADQDQPERAQPGQVVQQRLHRLAGRRPSSARTAPSSIGRRAVAAGHGHGGAVGGDRRPARRCGRRTGSPSRPAGPAAPRPRPRRRRRCGAWSRRPLVSAPAHSPDPASHSCPVKPGQRAGGGGRPVVGERCDVVDDAAAAAQPDDVVAGVGRLPGRADQQLRLLAGPPAGSPRWRARPDRSAAAAPGRRPPDRSARTPGWPPASVSASACPRWNIARSGRSSTNRWCTNLSTATSCQACRPSTTCPARTGGSAVISTDASRCAIQLPVKVPIARSAAIEESNGTASRPSTRSVATRPTATPKVSSSKIQPSRARSRRRSCSSATPGCRSAAELPTPARPRDHRRLAGPLPAGELVPPPDPGAELGRHRRVLQHPGPVEVVEIVQRVGDVVGDVHHRALHGLPQRSDLRVRGQHLPHLARRPARRRRTWPSPHPPAPLPPPRGGRLTAGWDAGCG